MLESARLTSLRWTKTRNYAAAEKRSASLSQLATRFHLGQIWALTLKPLIRHGRDRQSTPSIQPGQPSLVRIGLVIVQQYGDLIGVIAAEARGAVAGIRRGIRAGQDPLTVAAQHQLLQWRMDESPDDIKANYITLMGQRLGQDFSELMQDAARLHVKWNEFLPMYAGPKSRVNDMNRAAPGFFLAQHAWWNDIILHIFRMTDPDRRVLSIVKLSVPPELTTGFQARLTTLKTATRFAHRLRHEYIAHRNREVALEVRPVPPSSVADVNGAIAAIDDALHFIDHHFTKRVPTMYEHLDTLGGSESLIWIVRRGLAARDQDIEQLRPFMRFPD